MKVSVIIPTYNEQDVISHCLNSLASQTYKDFEVVVVDDGSTDKTLEILKQLSVSKYKLKIVNGTHSGSGAARNIGVKNSSGDILVFVDADMTFDENFLKSLVNPIVLGESKGTFSKDEMVSNWDKVWSRCYNLNEGWVEKRRHPKNYPDTQKVFRAIKRTEFDKVHGFTAGGYNDDWSLSEKLSYEATVVKNAIFYHKNPETLSEIYNHAKWVGKRSYKLGMLGFMVALTRASLPASIVVGLLRSVYYIQPAYLIFKIVYDFGIFVGITNYMFTKKGSK